MIFKENCIQFIDQKRYICKSKTQELSHAIQNSKLFFKQIRQPLKNQACTDNWVLFPFPDNRVCQGEFI